jgi:hypothetical protein
MIAIATREEGEGKGKRRKTFVPKLSKRPRRDSVIDSDDIANLKIDLELHPDLLLFLASRSCQ